MQKLLEKLGEAIYIHRALIKQANKAKDSVDYLVEQKVLTKSENK